MRKMRFLVSLCFLLCLLFSAGWAQVTLRLPAYSTRRPATDGSGNAVDPSVASAVTALHTFSYTVTSSRDGNTYTGVMVGQSPWSSGFTPTVVKTPVIPVIINTEMVATSLNSEGILSTVNGSTTFDPTIADTACLGSSNNVPLTLTWQSPILQPYTFVFGGETVGRKTQYVDAFQRANFWHLVHGSNYHTLLSPVLMKPITITFPGHDGVAIPAGAFGNCGPLGIVNGNDFDNIITGTVLPQLAAQGVDTSQFPIFLLHNLVLSIGAPNNLNNCCILGYHGATGSPVQTYSPVDFDSTGLFGPAVADTSDMAHEVAEWMDDPFGTNPTPAWGHTGQVSGCQNNLEVGDPLTGTNVPPVPGTNGFTYHLQELAFFSWFYGAPSIGVHGWFSDNDTFTTDAGPVCVGP